jgi:hypothetical protein
MNKLPTHEEVIALNHKWLDRVAKIAKRNKASAMSVLQIHMQINMAVYVLESGLTAENACEFIESELRAFEEEARNKRGFP